MLAVLAGTFNTKCAQRTPQAKHQHLERRQPPLSCEFESRCAKLRLSSFLSRSLASTMILTYAGRVPRIAPSAFVADSADIIGDVEIGENSSIWFTSVLRGDIEPIRIGSNSNIQDGSIVHTMLGSPAAVGNWVTVGHRAVLHGC